MLPPIHPAETSLELYPFSPQPRGMEGQPYKPGRNTKVGIIQRPMETTSLIYR